MLATQYVGSALPAYVHVQCDALYNTNGRRGVNL